MARSIDEIKKQTTDLLVSELAEAGVVVNSSTWSATNILRICVFIFAFCANILEKILDVFKADTTTYIANMKPGSELWYANKAKGYMHGHSLVYGEDYYSTTGLTEEQISAAKVVKHSAVNEHLNSLGRLYLRVKVAGENSTDLTQLSESVLYGLRQYMSRVKYAGVQLLIESKQPDRIKMGWKIYYDPLLIDANGNRLDGSATDVARVAIKEFLKQISFNGIYAIQKHEDYVQQVPGVVLCPVLFAQSAYGEYDWQNIDELIIPDAGYMRFESDDDLTIEYIAQSEI